MKQTCHLHQKPLKLAITFKQEGFVWVWIKLNYLHPLLTTLFNLWWNRFSGNSISITKLLATSGFKGVYAIDGGIEGPTTWPVCFSLFFPIIIPLFSLHDSLCSSFQFSNPQVLGQVGVLSKWIICLPYIKVH